MRVGLLGIQGAFRDHIALLERLQATPVVVKDGDALGRVDRLIIPGGESTVMARFLTHFGMTGPLRERILHGMPVWGICAGSILLARTVDGRPGLIGALPAGVKRNDYGRHAESTEQEIPVPVLGRAAFTAFFIRPPRIVSLERCVLVHAAWRNDPVFVQHGSVMATTFHPELTRDTVFHEYFLGI